MSTSAVSSPESPVIPLRLVLLGVLFLGAIALWSLPGARSAVSPLGPLPLWLLGMPLASLAALVLCDRLLPPSRDPVSSSSSSSTGSRRRAAPVQARRRAGGRPRRRGLPHAA